MNFDAVVFDMDGVLTDTEKVYRQCWLENGVSIGIPRQEMMLICDKLAGATKDTNAKTMRARMGEDFDYLYFRSVTMNMFEERINRNGIDLKDGVVELLTKLKEMGILTAVATSTDREKAVDRLKRVDLYKFFDKIVCGDDVPRGKPNPDIFLEACKQLEVSPARAIGVEDSINGVIASHTAGLHTVMVVDLIQPNDVTAANADNTYYKILDVLQLFRRGQ